MKITLFPNLKPNPTQRSNPYIQDFITALEEEENTTVVNPPHKNPLLSLLPPCHWGDTFIFNWFENIPDSKYGILQAIIAIVFSSVVKLSGRKIVWILHNQKPHTNEHAGWKKLLSWLIAQYSSLIVTHATDGVCLVKEKYPFAIHKTHFLHHPTKNKLPTDLQAFRQEKLYDLLIWGNISKYKGVTTYVSYVRKHPESRLRICIAGKCASDTLYDEIQKDLPPQITFIPHALSFEELHEYIRQSHFVLAPYCPESVLSSGILMDSLSFGCKVIGPHIGSFKDYADYPGLNVYTFHNFEDIERLVITHKDDPVLPEAYARFLDGNDWKHFVNKIIHLVTSK